MKYLCPDRFRRSCPTTTCSRARYRSNHRNPRYSSIESSEQTNRITSKWREQLARKNQTCLERFSAFSEDDVHVPTRFCSSLTVNNRNLLANTFSSIFESVRIHSDASASESPIASTDGQRQPMRSHRQTVLLLIVFPCRRVVISGYVYGARSKSEPGTGHQASAPSPCSVCPVKVPGCCEKITSFAT